MKEHEFLYQSMYMRDPNSVKGVDNIQEKQKSFLGGPQSVAVAVQVG